MGKPEDPFPFWLSWDKTHPRTPNIVSILVRNTPTCTKSCLTGSSLCFIVSGSPIPGLSYPLSLLYLASYFFKEDAKSESSLKRASSEGETKQRIQEKPYWTISAGRINRRKSAFARRIVNGACLNQITDPSGIRARTRKEIQYVPTTTLLTKESSSEIQVSSHTSLVILPNLS